MGAELNASLEGLLRLLRQRHNTHAHIRKTFSGHFLVGVQLEGAIFPQIYSYKL